LLPPIRVIKPKRLRIEICNTRNQASRPTSGTGAIALWLKQRQTDLDITDQEFERFCDSYRLLPIKLQGIYEGREIDSSMLTPLSRVLGCSVEEVLQVLEG